MKKDSEIYVIQNSGGRSSAYMTERLLQDPTYRDNCIILFQNTGKENDATLDFIHKCEERWLNLYDHSVHWLEYNPDNPKGFSEVDYRSAHRTADKTKKSPFEKLIEKRQWLPNRVARYCTQELKIRISKKFIMSLGYLHWTSFVGIRHDEPKRWNKVNTIDLKERFTIKYPMVEWGTTKADVNAFWKEMPFDLELKAYQGNCDLCFLKGVGKKRRIIRDNPEVADWWIRMENETGDRFRSEYSVQDLRDKINATPEFEFRDDYECDIECHCNID